MQFPLFLPNYNNNNNNNNNNNKTIFYNSKLKIRAVIAHFGRQDFGFWQGSKFSFIRHHIQTDSDDNAPGTEITFPWEKAAGILI
jgi:hypothetical protein